MPRSYSENPIGRAVKPRSSLKSLQLPQTVELTVTQCDPAARGNSATSRTKPATLQTGHIVHVPDYLKEGERVKVDTRTGEFLSRA